jgi:kynurenine formamidase
MDLLSRIANWLGEHEATISAVVGIAVLTGILFAGVRFLLHQNTRSREQQRMVRRPNATKRPLGSVLVLSGMLSAVLIPGVATAEDSRTSKWGPEDEIGAANYLGPEKVIAAAKLVTTGKTYHLGQEIKSDTPGYFPRVFHVYVNQPFQYHGRKPGTNHVGWNDDHIYGWMGHGTQLDSLAHIFIKDRYYNGFKDIVTPTGVRKLGIEKVPPIVGRGVLLDMASYFGVDIVEEGRRFGKAEIEEVTKRQGVEIREGDVVLFHTGWMNLIGKDNERFMRGEPGLDKEGASYLVEKHVVAIGADTVALEVIPYDTTTGEAVPVHEILIPRNGVYVLENLNTAQLAADRTYEFLFVLGAARVTGAVQMWVDPIAIR